MSAKDLTWRSTGYGVAIGVGHQDLVSDGQRRIGVMVNGDDPHAAGDKSDNQRIGVTLVGGTDGTGGLAENQ